jgi:hypothetical protein
VLVVSTPLNSHESTVTFPWGITSAEFDGYKQWIRNRLSRPNGCDISHHGSAPVIRITHYDDHDVAYNDPAFRTDLIDLLRPHLNGIAEARITQEYRPDGQHIATCVTLHITDSGLIEVSPELVNEMCELVRSWEVKHDRNSELCISISFTLRDNCLRTATIKHYIDLVTERLKIGVAARVEHTALTVQVLTPQGVDAKA